MTPRFICNDIEGVARAAIAGAGLAQIGSNIISRFVNEGALLPILTEFAAPSRGLYAVYASRRFTPEKVTAFISFIADCFADGPETVV